METNERHYGQICQDDAITETFRKIYRMLIDCLKKYTDDYIVHDTGDSWLREDDFIKGLQKAMED